MRMGGRRWHRLVAVAAAASLVVGATVLRTDADEDVAVRASGGMTAPLPEDAATTVTTAVTTSTAGEDPTVIAARRRPPTTSTTRPKPATTSTTIGTTTTTTTATGPAPGPAAGGLWTTLPPSPLGGRELHGMVWTGKEVLVMVGFKGQGSWKDSAAYNPATKTWRSLPEAPQSGWGHAQGVWTGREAIIWGAGDGASDPVSMAYDPAKDQWRRISPGPLGMRTFPTLVWTGQEVLVWGGYDISYPPPDHSASDGAAYDPVTDTWRRLAASPLAGRFGHTAVWTGTEMLIWGGVSGEENGPPLPEPGAAYDPATDTWRSMAAGPLTPAFLPTAAWAGTQLFVWTQGHGASYDPAADRWTTLPDGYANPRSEAVWTGREIVVFGDNCAQTYDPQTRTWHGQSSVPPAITSVRVGHRMVWTGTEVVVFGGRTGPGLLADGAAWRRSP